MSKQGRIAAMLVAAAAAINGCVDAGSIVDDSNDYIIDLRAGQPAQWTAPSDGPLAGLLLTFGERAIAEDAQLEVYPLIAGNSPIDDLPASDTQRYRLVAPAFGLRPQGVFFFDRDAEVRVVNPVSHGDNAQAYRLITASSLEALPLTWSFSPVVTSPVGDPTFVGVIEQTQEYWPVEVTEAVLSPEVSGYELCVVEDEDPLYQTREEPQITDECDSDDDCNRSGCGFESCSAGAVSSFCLPTDPKCDAGCRCASGTCRWVNALP